MAEFFIDITNEAGAVEQVKLQGGEQVKKVLAAFKEADLTLRKMRIDGHGNMVAALDGEGNRVWRAETGEFGRSLGATALYVMAMATD